MRHVALKRLCAGAVNTFEHDPDFQVRFHFAAMVFWIVNAVLGVLCYLFLRSEWLSIGVLYVFLLSIYANWDTDYDAVSAASSFKHAKAADQQLKNGDAS